MQDQMSSNVSMFQKHFEELVIKKNIQMPPPKILIQYSWSGGGAQDSAF